jgi:hypothetical protein
MGISAGANAGTYLYNALGDGAREFDVDAMEDEFRTAVAAVLDGTGITLVGGQFYGPVEPTDEQTAAQDALDIRQAIEDIDVYEIARRHELSG